MDALASQEREDRIKARSKMISFYSGLVEIIKNFPCNFKSSNVAFMEGEHREVQKAWLKLYSAACDMRNLAQAYQLQDVAEGELEK